MLVGLIGFPKHVIDSIKDNFNARNLKLGICAYNLTKTFSKQVNQIFSLFDDNRFKMHIIHDIEATYYVQTQRF